MSTDDSKSIKELEREKLTKLGSKTAVKTIKGYSISDIDDAAFPKYFGFLTKQGAWYIMKLTATGARYIKGDTDYPTNWGVRDTLVYDYYNIIFG